MDLNIENTEAEKKYYPVAVGKIKDITVTFTTNGKDTIEQATQTIYDWEDRYNIIEAKVDVYQGKARIESWIVTLSLDEETDALLLCPDT